MTFATVDLFKLLIDQIWCQTQRGAWQRSPDRQAPQACTCVEGAVSFRFSVLDTSKLHLIAQALGRSWCCLLAGGQGRVVEDSVLIG